MGLVPKFFIEQHRDGRSFTFRDITGEYDEEENPGGFGSPNPAEEDVVTVALTVLDPKGDEYLYEGVYLSELEIFTEDIGYPKTLFEDGVYKFKVVYETVSDVPFESESWEFFGFAAIISGEIMRASLDYHPSESVSKKEWILEQHRLLNNLRFSAQTGNLEYFDENLEQLQKIR